MVENSGIYISAADRSGAVRVTQKLRYIRRVVLSGDTELFFSFGYIFYILSLFLPLSDVSCCFGVPDGADEQNSSWETGQMRYRYHWRLPRDLISLSPKRARLSRAYVHELFHRHESSAASLSSYQPNSPHFYTRERTLDRMWLGMSVVWRRFRPSPPLHHFCFSNPLSVSFEKRQHSFAPSMKKPE